MNFNTWEFEDFKAYLFIYCSFIDNIEVTPERNFAIQKLGKKRFNEAHKEIEKDSDGTSIKKIKSYIRDNRITKAKAEQLILDVKELFLSDKEFHKLEKQLYKSLKKVFLKNGLLKN